MQALVERYKEDPKNKELEVRIRDIQWEDWQLFFNRCKENYRDTFQLEQTITFISGVSKPPRRVQNRREILFKNGVKQPTGERLIYKKAIMETIQQNYKYSLAEEIPINTFDSHSLSLIRLRLRASFVSAAADWRIDFTFVQEVQPSQTNQLPQFKEKMFPLNKIITEDNFLEFIAGLGNPNDPRFKWELELEYVGDPAALTVENAKRCIGEMLHIFDPDAGRLQKIHDLAKLFYDKERLPRSLKQFANQPIAMVHKDFTNTILPNIDSYYLSDKADGERGFLHISCGDTKIIELLLARSVMDISDYAQFHGKECQGTTLIDAEILFDKPAKSAKPKSTKPKSTKPKSVKKKGGEDDINDLMTYHTESVEGGDEPIKRQIHKIYIFDILMLNDKNFTHLPFSEREKEFERVAKWFSPITEKKIQIPLSRENYIKQIKDIYERGTRLYPIDGLIFTPKNENYFNMTVYKWKPPDKNTVDFLIIRAPKNIIGVKPYLVDAGKELYFLLCGIKYDTFRSLNLEYFPGYRETFTELGLNLRDNYFPIQFSPSEQPLAYLWQIPASPDAVYHGHVGEFRYSTKTETWDLLKMRPDKDINIQEGTAYGNDFKVAEETFQQFFHPFTFEMMVEKTTAEDTKGYFQEAKNPIYKALTKFNNFVKAQLARQLERSHFVIEFAGGRDLFTLSGFNVRNILFVDKDAEALVELNKRRYELSNPAFYLYGKPPKIPPSIYTKEADLTEPSKKIRKMFKDIPFPRDGVDGIVINFAIHYLVSDQKSLDNFIDLVSSLLKPGGIFIFTCFDGQRVFDMLRETDFESSWDLYEDEVLKYSIKKNYQSDILTEYGQKIGVIHPFSKGAYYEENLINVDVVLANFQKRGFEIRQNASFVNWLSKFRTFNSKIASQLTPEDIKYASLYQYVSLWKSPPSKSINLSQSSNKN
jgi:SAM-dependent methyltransferase